MPESITIPPRSPHLVALVSRSALNGCTTLTHEGQCVTVTRLWPNISSGEERLWITVQRLIALRHDADDLDDHNARAVADALRATADVIDRVGVPS